MNKSKIQQLIDHIHTLSAKEEYHCHWLFVEIKIFDITKQLRKLYQKDMEISKILDKADEFAQKKIKNDPFEEFDELYLLELEKYLYGLQKENTTDINKYRLDTKTIS